MAGYTSFTLARTHLPGGISRGALLCIVVGMLLAAVMLLSSCSLEGLRAGTLQAQQQAEAAQAAVEALRAQAAAIDRTDPAEAETAAAIDEQLATAEAVAVVAVDRFAAMNAQLAQAETAGDGAIIIGQAIVPLLPPPYGTLASFALGAMSALFQTKRNRESGVARGVEAGRDRALEAKIEAEVRYPVIVVDKARAQAAHEALGVTHAVKAGTV